MSTKPSAIGAQTVTITNPSSTDASTCTFTFEPYRTVTLVLSSSVYSASWNPTNYYLFFSYKPNNVNASNNCTVTILLAGSRHYFS